jgi:hypothetical protein
LSRRDTALEACLQQHFASPGDAARVVATFELEVTDATRVVIGRVETRSEAPVSEALQRCLGDAYRGAGVKLPNLATPKRGTPRWYAQRLRAAPGGGKPRYFVVP